MCGILGLMSYSGTPLNHLQVKMVHRAITELLKESEIRGSDASGLAVLTDKKMSMFKEHVKASDLVSTPEYGEIMKEINKTNCFKAMIGHTRLKTKGHQRYNINNHPIRANRIVGVHNGWISNDDFLFEDYRHQVDRRGRVDSEIIFRLIDLYRRQRKTLIGSVKEMSQKVVGSYACAFLDSEAPDYVTVFTNGSFSNVILYVYRSIKMVLFASTESILSTALSGNMLLDPRMATSKTPLTTGGVRLNTKTGEILRFYLNEEKASEAGGLIGGN